MAGSRGIAALLVASVAMTTGCAPAMRAPSELPVERTAPLVWDRSVDAAVSPSAAFSPSAGFALTHFSGGDDEVNGNYSGGDYGYSPYTPGYPYGQPYYGEIDRPYYGGGIGVSGPTYAAEQTGPPSRIAIRVSGDATALTGAARMLDRAYVPLRLCYEELLNREPSAEGSVTIAFTIGKDGKVQKGASTSGTPTDEDLGKCLVKTVGEVGFGLMSAEAKLSATLDLKVAPPPPAMGGLGLVPTAEAAEVEHDATVRMK